MIAQLFDGSTALFHVTGSVWFLLLLGYALHYTPRSLFAQLREGFLRLPAPAQGVVLAGVASGLMLVATEDVVPYIYFQF